MFWRFRILRMEMTLEYAKERLRFLGKDEICEDSSEALSFLAERIDFARVWLE